MRHLNAGRKLNRSSSHRRALLRNLVTSLLQHEHLQTTDAKAKEMRRWVDRMITLGKRDSGKPSNVVIRGTGGTEQHDATLSLLVRGQPGTLDQSFQYGDMPGIALFDGGQFKGCLEPP